MKITYNGLALHELGDVQIVGQRSTFVPLEAPVVRRVEMSIRIEFNEANWWLNRNLVNRVTACFSNPHGILDWRHDDLPTASLTGAEATAGGRRLFSGRAFLQGHDLPDDPNSWGSAQQAIVLSFTYEDPEVDPSLFDATFTPLSGSPLTLGRVTEFGFLYQAARYSPLRDERSRSSGTVTVSGMWSPRVSQTADEPAGLGSIVPDLAAMRSGIIAQFTGMLAAVNQKRGTLRFGQRPAESGTPVELFNQAVRVTAFTGQPDQHNRAVPWTLTAEYTLFPNEGGFAQAEFAVKTRRELEGGAHLLTLSGQIVADSRASADAKLESIREAALPAGAVMTGTADPTEQRIDGADGAAFIQLSFDESYRVARESGLVRIQYRVDAENDLLGLERRTSVRGQVGCVNHAEANTVLTALLASSEFAGFGPLIRSSRGDARVTDGTTEHLLEFSFANEYRGAIYDDAPVNSSVLGATFAPVSGGTISLGRVIEFGFSYQANRYSPLRDERSRAGGVVTLRGVWAPELSGSPGAPSGLGPAVPPLATVRSAIIAKFAAVRDAVNQKRGTLRFGQLASGSPTPPEVFNQTVRVTGFTAQPDQADRSVPWTLTAEYSLFPNEGGFALAEFSVKTRTELEGSANLLSFSGQIVANSRAAADLKLDSIRTAMIPAGAVMTGSTDPSEQHIDGPDGAAFLQLAFDETYRVGRQSGLVRIQYRIDVQTDLLALERRTSVRGQVGCASRAEGDTALSALLTSAEFAGFGPATRTLRGEARLTDGTTTHLLEFSFENEYRAALSGQAGILETNVSETIRHTGINWVIRPTAFGRPLAQACGYLPGSRTVRAQVVSVDEATARSWMASQYSLAFPGTTPATRYRRPPEITMGFAFAPRINGVARGSGANTQVFRGDLAAEEDLLEYDYS